VPQLSGNNPPWMPSRQESRELPNFMRSIRLSPCFKYLWTEEDLPLWGGYMSRIVYSQRADISPVKKVNRFIHKYQAELSVISRGYKFSRLLKCRSLSMYRYYGGSSGDVVSYCGHNSTCPFCRFINVVADNFKQEVLPFFQSCGQEVYVLTTNVKFPPLTRPFFEEDMLIKDCGLQNELINVAMSKEKVSTETLTKFIDIGPAAVAALSSRASAFETIFSAERTQVVSALSVILRGHKALSIVASEPYFSGVGGINRCTSLTNPVSYLGLMCRLFIVVPTQGYAILQYLREVLLNFLRSEVAPVKIGPPRITEVTDVVSLAKKFGGKFSYDPNWNLPSVGEWFTARSGNKYKNALVTVSHYGKTKSVYSSY